MGGVGEKLCQVPIVRQNQQARGVHVQATRGIQVGALVFDEIQHRMAGMRVSPRAGVAHGLVAQQVDLALRLQDPPVHSDRVCLGVGPGAKFGDDPAVYGDPTGSDQGFAVTP